jgi:hypothetical protein
MSNKEKFTTTLDAELLRKLKILAINRKCSANALIEEAIGELMSKYEKEPPLWGVSPRQRETPPLAVRTRPSRQEKERKG